MFSKMDESRVRRIEKILAESRKNKPFSFVDHVVVDRVVNEQADGSSDDEQMPPPPFTATIISPPNYPITVYVGGVSDAMYPAALQEKSIVAILNVAYSQCIESQRIMKMSVEKNSQWDKVEFSQSWYMHQTSNPNFQYMGISAEDHPKYRIGRHFAECIDFIDKVPHGKAVLVHCMQGYNRSVAICVAWLLRKTEFSLEHVIKTIASQRPLILSNRAFIRELVFLDSEEEQIDATVSQKIFSIGEVVERI
jgi:protein-tyrosine phosphatase